MVGRIAIPAANWRSPCPPAFIKEPNMRRSFARYFHLAALAVTLASLLVANARADEPAAKVEEGFKSLFDGKSLDGWDGDPKFWSVEDGAITGRTTKENPTKGNTFVIWAGNVGDFELRLSYKIVGGNSGIQYRSARTRTAGTNGWVVGGYQADFEAGDHYSGILYEERGRGTLAERGQKVVIDAKGKINVAGSVGDADKIQAGIKKEDWNDYVVTAKGNHLTHAINGMTTIDLVDEQESRAATSGILALQLHAGPPMVVQFKNIRLKTFDSGASAEK
jgi:hypothetical protein